MFWLSAGDGDSGSSNCSGDEEGACLDAVRDDSVIGSVEFGDSLDLDMLRAGTGNPGSHGGEEVSEINDLGFFRGSLDDGSPLGEDGGHHDITRAEDGRAVAAAQVDAGSLELVGVEEDVSTLHGHLRTEGLEALQVEVYWSVADDAAAGKGNLR